jgi:DNA helicase-2/ATP-dependent DNA helicase PcrA
MTPSKYQQAVLDAVLTDTSNLMVQAVAGSGKTATLTMICKAVIEARPKTSILAVAFNAEIAKTLKEKLPPAVQCCTMHSYGKRVIFDNFPSCDRDIDDRGKKQQLVMDEMFNPLGLQLKVKLRELDEQKTAPGAKRADIEAQIAETERMTKEMQLYRATFVKVVAMVRSTFTDPSDWTAIDAMCEDYDLDIDGMLEVKTPVEITKDITTALDKLRKNHDVIDFDDMLDLVVHYKLKGRHDFDLVLVDESQDLNKLQAEFIRLIVEGRHRVNSKGLDDLLGDDLPAATQVTRPDVGRPTENRVVFVGDVRQAIYLFRGADARSMDNLAKTYQTTQLPLSISYRCSHAVVDLARTIIGPNIEPFEKAKPGAVIYNKPGDFSDMLKDLGNGDIVMCRVNAPLVGAALKCIRLGKRATVRGRGDMCSHLLKFVTDARKKAKSGSMPAFLTSLEAIFKLKVQKAIDAGKPAQADTLGDTFECIKGVAGDVKSVDQLIDFVKNIFKDKDSKGISFSSIHRAKGQEADRVVILGPELLPHPMAYRSINSEAQLEQERNIAYVAVTRSKDRLTLQPLEHSTASPFAVLQDMYRDAEAKRAARGASKRPAYGEFITPKPAVIITPTNDVSNVLDF